MDNLTLNVYDTDDNIIKTCEAQFVELRFGAIRSIMKLLKVDQIETNLELMEAVYGAWEQLTGILGKCFPDMTDADWDNVKMSELMPVVVSILKQSFNKMMDIPREKNA